MLKNSCEIEAFYHQDNVFYLTEESRWSYLIANAKQEDIALKIDTALHNIEKKNKALQGALRITTLPLVLI